MGTEVETNGSQPTSRGDASRSGDGTGKVDESEDGGEIAESGAECHRTIGYARVSTGGQDLQLQLDALRQAGVVDELLFTDRASGAKASRPGLERCLAELRPGDVLLVWRLDRLGRSVAHLVTLIEDLRSRGIGFRSVCDGAIDTTSASGELIFNVFAALAQFERRLIAERTKAGLAAARARGRFGGRPRIEADDPRVVMAKALHRDQSMSIPDICRSLRFSRATLYRYLKIHAASVANEKSPSRHP